jgi:aminomethyltransferase
MPLQYSSIPEEHMAVRERAGLFDVSHMGEFLIRGRGALDFLQFVTSNDVSKLEEGGAQYSMVLNERGGVKDDVVIYRQAKARFLLVCNAANTAKLEAWLREHASEGVELENLTETTVLLALQGPAAQEILQPITSIDLRAVGRFQGTWGGVAGQRVWIGRTGYTGEDGFELYLFGVSEPKPAEQLWNSLMRTGAERGLRPCGIGARDTTRLEAGFCFYGKDLTEEITPLEARLSSVVRFDKGKFVGREPLLELKERGLPRVRVGLKMLEAGIPREGHRVLLRGEVIGSVTSGTFSPLLKCGIAMGYVSPKVDFGERVAVEIHGKPREAEIVEWPFYDRARYGWAREA